MVFPILTLAAGALAGSAVSLAAFSPGFGDVITAFMNSTFRARIPTAAELGRMRQMGMLSESAYEALMADTGFSEANTRRLWDSLLDGLSPGDILRLYYRYVNNPTTDFPVSPQWFRERMQQAGIRESVLNEWLEANRPVPTLQDEIVFAVRDVYEPEQVQQAGLMEGLPEEWVQRVSRLGLRREDAEKYWASHWQLPSLTQVYEMYHRLYPGSGHATEFTDHDMNIFFNLADIAPGYRQRLKDISYNPLTRVDIRRMYSMGMYGSGENALPGLIRDYRQLGYSPQDALRLSQFTVREFGSGRKKFTSSQITKFYLNGMWGENTKNEAVKEFERLGYDTAQAELILRWIDLQSINQKEQAEIDSIRSRYLAGEFEDSVALQSALLKIPVTVEKARQLELEFQKEKLKNQSRLSKSDVDRLFTSKQISEQQYRQYLSRLGYIDRDIDLLVKSAGKDRILTPAKPTKEDVVGWYESDIITPISFVRLMREIGYRDELIQYYAIASSRPFDDSITRKMSELPKDEDYEI